MGKGWENDGKMMEHVDNPLELGVLYDIFQSKPCATCLQLSALGERSMHHWIASVSAAGLPPNGGVSSPKFPGFGEFFLMNSWFGELVLLKTSYETHMNYQNYPIKIDDLGVPPF